MNFIDTHCHLYAEEFKDDYLPELKRANDAHVEALILPAIDSESHQSLFALADEAPCCYPLIGLHPTSVGESYNEELQLVEQYLASRKVYGIGEVGIDLYWSKEFRHQQQEVFDYQIQLALKHSLPLVIHSREAFSEIFDILKAYKGQPLFGIFHAFTGDVETYRAISALGDFAVGIGGIVTFKNSGLADVVAEIPLERIVLETDSPYLAPTPHRGKRNVPAFIPLIAAKVAQIKNVTVSDVAGATTTTAKSIFNI
ncbi:TatD family hydrolase [uncultured Acetobacteroides sp.]|uniref:TatD family hydrolase n=1 Tax=uncultured Acetobacteroides sp. TaxID=1760811 RepID=UPI0029F5542F|nr:TatD family hydrolase [uncultured Acetobacteroides sp.]